MEHQLGPHEAGANDMYRQGQYVAEDTFPVKSEMPAGQQQYEINANNTSTTPGENYGNGPTSSSPPPSSIPPPVPSVSFLYSLTLLSSLGSFMFGYDIGVVSSVVILLHERFQLSSVWQELVVGLVALSAAVAALIGGFFNHVLGRKPVILGASLIYTAGVLCQAMAPDRISVIIGRILVGTAIGLETTTVPIYIAESSPTSIRGRLVSTHMAMIAFGQFVGTLVSGALNGANEGWRIMLGIGVLPALIQFFGFILMPESPRWLLRRGEVQKAEESFVKARGVLNPDVLTKEFNLMNQLVSENERERQDRGGRHLIIIQILKTPSVRRAMILGCSLQMFQQLAGINTIMYYSATIIRMSGIKDKTAEIWLSALTALVNFIFTIVGLYLVEKIGRRPLIIASLSGAIFSLGWLAVGFQMTANNSPKVTTHELINSGTTCHTYTDCNQCMLDVNCGFCYVATDHGPDNATCLKTSYENTIKSTLGRCNSTVIQSPLTWAYDYCPTQYSWMPVIGLVVYMIFFAPGMGPMPWTINSEIYPAWARSTGNAISTFTNWLFSMLISVTFLTTTETLTRHGTFWMYTIFSGIGLGMVFCLLPETKGKTLEEVEGLFAQPWFGRGGSSAVHYGGKSVQYLHIHGLNKDIYGNESEED